MNHMKDLIKNGLALTQIERLGIAQEAIQMILKYFNKEKGEDMSKKILFSYYTLFITADKKCDYNERVMFNTAFMTSLSKEEFNHVMKYPTKEQVRQMENITILLPEDIRAAIVSLGLAIMCSDGKMTQSEKKIFKKMIYR